jgi:hypothetical protein
MEVSWPLSTPKKTQNCTPETDTLAGALPGPQGVVDSCVFIHQAVERRSKKYYDELRRWGG